MNSRERAETADGARHRSTASGRMPGRLSFNWPDLSPFFLDGLRSVGVILVGMRMEHNQLPTRQLNSVGVPYEP